MRLRHKRANIYMMNKDIEPINLRDRLYDGETVIGTWLSSCSPIIAEIMATCGFDFVCVDAEHSAVDLAATQQIFQAIRSGSRRSAALVRVPGVDYANVKRYLDAGADGIVAPLVRAEADVRLLIEACKYPPAGSRGVGFCRANDYGLHLGEEFEQANNVTIVAVQIEHIDAVRNIDEILAVPGIDVAFIGPYDLSASMGIAAKFDHPDYNAALTSVLDACQRHQVVAGIHSVPPDPTEALLRLSEGYRFLAYSLDIAMVAAGCSTGLQSLRTSAVQHDQSSIVVHSKE